jgi:3-hydroxybutyryl-CoA dehydrogenase
MSESGFKTAVSIGTGIMGPGTGVALAVGGLRTTILSRDAERASRALEAARGQLGFLESQGLLTREHAEAACRRLSASTDLAAAIADADIVIESSPEDMVLKRELFAWMDSVAPPETILASNTSGLSISAIAVGCMHPERVLTAHFWNPPHLMPLVEIVRIARTCEAVVARVAALLIQCGKTPVVIHKDTPGQLGNRLQMALLREAVHIVQEGIADAESVDLAAKMSFGLRLPVMGILEHQDMIGVDLSFAVLDYVAPGLYNHPGAPRLMHEMLQRGELGVKTGKGFYDWGSKDVQAIQDRRDQFLAAFLRGRL